MDKKDFRALLEKVGIWETAGPKLEDEALDTLEMIKELGDTKEKVLAECEDMEITPEDAEELHKCLEADKRLPELINELEALAPHLSDGALQAAHAKFGGIAGEKDSEMAEALVALRNVANDAEQVRGVVKIWHRLHYVPRRGIDFDL